MNMQRDFEGYIDRLYRRHGRQWAFRGRTAAQFQRWQTTTRLGFARLLMLRNRERVPLRLRRQVVQTTDEYVRVRIAYDTLPGITVPAFLLIPRRIRLPAPAVLCPPGHGAGMNQVLDEAPGIYKQYPFKLVRRGLVVLVPEHVGFGERVADRPEHKRSTHRYNYLALNLLGESQTGIMAWDLMRALDVLTALPEVRADRIGCYGLSLGGEMTLLLSALDRRIRMACVSGFYCSYRNSFLDEEHCGCGYSFDLLRHLEMLDIAALIAPRPLLFETATRDQHFPVADARRRYRELKKIYALCGAADAVRQEVFEGRHEISGRVAPDWLARQLCAE